MFSINQCASWAERKLRTQFGVGHHKRINHQSSCLSKRLRPADPHRPSVVSSASFSYTKYCCLFAPLIQSAAVHPARFQEAAEICHRLTSSSNKVTVSLRGGGTSLIVDKVTAKSTTKSEDVSLQSYCLTQRPHKYIKQRHSAVCSHTVVFKPTRMFDSSFIL